MPKNRRQCGVMVTDGSLLRSTGSSQPVSSVTGPNVRPPGTSGDGTVISSTSIVTFQPLPSVVSGPTVKSGFRRSSPTTPRDASPLQSHEFRARPLGSAHGIELDGPPFGEVGERRVAYGAPVEKILPPLCVADEAEPSVRDDFRNRARHDAVARLDHRPSAVERKPGNHPVTISPRSEE